MKTSQKQQGVVLISSLFIVLILTILIFSAARSTIMQEKMSGNLRERDLTFQSAETALLTGEKYLQSINPLPVFANDSGKYVFDKARVFQGDNSWDNLTTSQYSQSLYQVQGLPKYLIEKIAIVDTVGESLDASKPEFSNYYRVTSRSDNGHATVVLQSIYRR